MYLRSETSCWSARCCPEILLLLMMTALDMDCLPYYLMLGDCLDHMLLLMSLARPSTMMMMMLTMALTMVLTDPALAKFLHRSHDELPLVLPQPEMPQLPQQQHGCQDKLPLVLQTDDVLPQPEPGPDEQLLPLHSLAEGGLTMISLAWGGVVPRILLGEEDLATLRCSLAQQRSEAARISSGQGDLASLRCYSWAEGGESKTHQTVCSSVDAEESKTHCCSWIKGAETTAASLYGDYCSCAEGGDSGHCSCAEGGEITDHCCSCAEGGETTDHCSCAEGGETTDHCSCAEGGHIDCCSSSMATTLGLLWGRMEERKEIDEMTTYTKLPRH